MFRIFTGNKYIEKRYFDGIVQPDCFDPRKLDVDMYTIAAVYDLGLQFSTKYDNIFIKLDQEDREMYMSIIESDYNKSEKRPQFKLKEQILNGGGGSD